jgi:hypothetical protein
MKLCGRGGVVNPRLIVYVVQSLKVANMLVGLANHDVATNTHGHLGRKRPYQGRLTRWGTRSQAAPFSWGWESVSMSTKGYPMYRAIRSEKGVLCKHVASQLHPSPPPSNPAPPPPISRSTDACECWRQESQQEARVGCPCVNVTLFKIFTCFILDASSGRPWRISSACRNYERLR